VFGKNPNQQQGQMVPQAAQQWRPQTAGQMMPPLQSGQTVMPQPQMMQPQNMYLMGAVPMGGRQQEQTYVENILRMNRGKIATVYTTNENNPEWAAKVFTGRVENAARDHVVLSDPQTGKRYIIFMVNIDYITFDEELQYQPSFYGQS
jgi:spore germination protein Q